jgi:hypothetical protein
LNSSVSDGRVYDNFQVTGAGWTIDSLWSNDLMSFTTTSADWEIRSGVSTGNGGTLVASGTSSATQTATGRSALGFTEYQILVSGLNISLGPGTYWLAVTPIGTGTGRSGNTTTSNANGVGTLLDGGAFINSTFFSNNFASFDDPTVDFSMGIDGTEVAPVPEPASLTLLGLGLAGMGARRWRQRKA